MGGALLVTKALHSRPFDYHVAWLQLRQAPRLRVHTAYILLLYSYATTHMTPPGVDAGFARLRVAHQALLRAHTLNSIHAMHEHHECDHPLPGDPVPWVGASTVADVHEEIYGSSQARL